MWWDKNNIIRFIDILKKAIDEKKKKSNYGKFASRSRTEGTSDKEGEFLWKNQ